MTVASALPGEFAGPDVARPGEARMDVEEEPEEEEETAEAESEDDEDDFTGDEASHA